MRISYLDLDYCHQRYTADRKRVEEFRPCGQASWYFQAHTLVGLAKTAYALGRPLAEVRFWLREATVAYRQLFTLRGTSFSRRTTYKDGKPEVEEKIPDDGYTSVDSFEAALVSLSLRDIDLARNLVELAGPSPNAALVSPQSEVCTTNEQTLSHALNALLASQMEVADHGARKLTVRRATNIEKQIALTISAIANGGDGMAERDALLFYHEKLAARRENQTDASYWISLPALGLSSLAMHFRGYERADLRTDSVYCPVALLTESEACVTNATDGTGDHGAGSGR
jgi:hypothetical protein